MSDKYFTVENYPQDIYNAVGQIIKASQEWEQEYKKLACLINIPAKKVNKSSLNKLNDALKKERLISKTDYDKLKKIIDMRNYINHDFFLTDFEKEFDDFDEKMHYLEDILNAVQYLVYEATDYIDNKIDVIRKRSIMRPTVFD